MSLSECSMTQHCGFYGFCLQYTCGAWQNVVSTFTSLQTFMCICYMYMDVFIIELLAVMDRLHWTAFMHSWIGQLLVLFKNIHCIKCLFWFYQTLHELVCSSCVHVAASCGSPVRGCSDQVCGLGQTAASLWSFQVDLHQWESGGEGDCCHSVSCRDHPIWACSLHLWACSLQQWGLKYLNCDLCG